MPTTPCRIYRGPVQSKGYGAPTFRGQQVALHRWVVEQAEGRPLAPGEVVMHHCDTPACFRYDHLQRATQAENIRDAVAKGRHRFVAHRGETNGGGGKLTRDQVAEIRRRHQPGQGGNTVTLAREFGVGATMVRRIVRGDAWK